MLDFLSRLACIRADDGPDGLMGLNLRMTKFAEDWPVPALLIIGALVALVIFLVVQIAA